MNPPDPSQTSVSLKLYFGRDKMITEKSTVHRTKQWQIVNEQDQVFNLLRF